jgi:hypothetical protein
MHGQQPTERRSPERLALQKNDARHQRRECGAARIIDTRQRCQEDQDAEVLEVVAAEQVQNAPPARPARKYGIRLT